MNIDEIKQNLNLSIQKINSANPCNKVDFYTILSEVCLLKYNDPKIGQRIFQACGSKINAFAMKYPREYDKAIGIKSEGVLVK